MGRRSPVVKSVSWTRPSQTYRFEDYPPGTPLPEFPEPDLSQLNPVLRAWARRRLKKARAMHRQRIEAARDAYFRKKASGD